MDWKRIRAPVLACAALVLTLAFAAAPAWADEHSCDPERLPPTGVSRWEGYEVTRMSVAGTFRGGNGPDFIIGSSGPDTIYGEYGRDVVCAGDGNDVVYGGGLGDDLHGQGDLDKLFGELLDDRLYGGVGRDVLIGGHGTDELVGGEGNDWLRGGTNVDHYDGGTNIDMNDNDVASFADATPTGGHVEGRSGVVVNLRRPAERETGEKYLEGVAPETAKGGGEDTIVNVESVVGSAFDDRIASDPNVRNQRLYGGMGSDSCTPTACIEPSTNLTAPFAYVDTYNAMPIEPVMPDPMLIAVGGSGSETFTLSNGGSSFTVTAAAGGAAETLATVETEEARCSSPTRGTVTCTIASGTPRAGGQMWFGGAGGDTMTDRTAAPNGMTTDLDGGDDSDAITGSTGSETLVSGQSGNDVLHGGDGPDALLALGTGGDVLWGDNGNDQLATGEPCAGHVYHGGGEALHPDQDVAGFARTTESGVIATLGNPNGDAGTVGSSFYGAAYRHRSDGGNACAGGAVTWVGGDSEILEGTNQSDFLFGNQNDNTIWARSGNDNVHAGAGNDIVEANAGVDTVFAEAGADRVTGGPEADTIHGEEGADDLEGEGENDTLLGDDGNDRLSGGANADTLRGGRGLDTLFGDDGADWLYGEAENDRLRARDGIADNAVNCGEQTDEPVEADPFDPVTNCE